MTTLESYLNYLQESKIDNLIRQTKENTKRTKEYIEIDKNSLKRWAAGHKGTSPFMKNASLKYMKDAANRIKGLKQALASNEELLKKLIAKKKLYKAGKIGAVGAGVGAAGYGAYRYLKNKKGKK